MPTSSTPLTLYLPPSLSFPDPLLLPGNLLSVLSKYISLVSHISYFLLVSLALLSQYCHSIPTKTLFTNATTFPSLIMSLKILFIMPWNIAGEFVIQKNITMGLYDPTCIVKATFYSSPSLILTLL